MDAARLCSTLGRPEQAADLLARLPPSAIDALDDEPQLVMVARVLIGAGRHDEAIRILQSVKRRFPAGGAAFLLLGRAFLAKQMPDLAEEELRIAMGLPLPPDQELESAYLLGCVLETARKDAEAMQVFYGVLQKDFGYADVEQRYRRLKESQASSGVAGPSNAHLGAHLGED
jgi:tetratricopeptide (TPR) repeat protein